MVQEEDLILVHPPHKIIKYKVTERCLSCTSIKTGEFTVTYDLEDRKIIDQVGSGLASEYGYMIYPSVYVSTFGTVES